MAHNVWAEYDSAAEWCAKRGHSGDVGSPLPEGISSQCCALIETDPESFARHVKATAYALAMEENHRRFPEED